MLFCGFPKFKQIHLIPSYQTIPRHQTKDMVRISDARMSGTAFGTVILHVSPESAMGGPINFIQDGDIITLDVNERSLYVGVSDEELAKRKSKWVPPPPPPSGYARLFHDRIEGKRLCAS